MPKCSGPTCWTRGWSTPRGLPTDMGTRRPEGRLREREVAMRQASKKMDRAHPIFAAGASERELFKTKPTYQGTHLFFLTHGPGRVSLPVCHAVGGEHRAAMSTTRSTARRPG